MNKASHTILPHPAHSRRAPHLLKPLPIAALAALLAAPAAWADGGGTTIWTDAYLGTNGTTAKASGNKVSVTGSYNLAAGGFSDKTQGPEDFSGVANDNNLTIESGSTVNDAFGGYAYGASPTQAKNNTVTIKGTVNTGVNGGLSDNGPATGNTVTLAGGTVAGDVFGGVCNSGCDDVSGNTLAVEAKGSTVGGDVGSFEKLSFALPADIAAGETMLKVGGGAYFPATTTSVAISGSPALNGGESITLIDAAGTLEITPETQTVTAGSLTFEVKKANNKLIATVKGGSTGGGYSGGGDSSSPTMGELGLLLSGIALAGAAAPALRRREKQGKKADTRQ